MGKLDYQAHYRRHLPHFQPAGATLFVTARLAGSLPQTIIARLRAEQAEREDELQRIADPVAREAACYENQKRFFGRFDAALDNTAHGPTWLAQPAVATVVYQSILYRDGKVYALDACTVMSNHIHLVFRPLEDADGRPHALSGIMNSLKRRSAREANKVLGRTGAFWQHESYDHVVRDEAEWQRIVRYVLENPVKAGLVDDWEAWPWTYLRDS